MADQGRIRISLSAGELEVEGSAEFVAKYDDAIAAMLGRLREQPAPALRASGSVKPQSDSRAVPAGSTELGEFGEVLHALPKGASGVEQILVAGYYAAQANADKTFSTADANKLLIDQGVKLSNASQALKNNLGSKRVFKSGKAYKVSRTGEEYVQGLIHH